MANGHIYKSSYAGWYSVNDECFLTDDQVRELLNFDPVSSLIVTCFCFYGCCAQTVVRKESKGTEQRFSLESGHQVEYASETNYVFKLSQYKEQLRSYLKQNIITPPNYAEILHAQLDDLQDLSVSRESSRIHWGIQVDLDAQFLVQKLGIDSS